MLRKIKLIAFVSFLSLSGNIFADKYIHVGQLIDMTDSRVQSKVTIVVKGNKIESIQQGFVTPGKDDELIDLSDYTVLPGLMDMHVHLTGEMSPSSYVTRFTDEPADVAYKTVVYAKRTLDAGFTTVRNLGDGDNITVSLRDAINKGLIEGPRIFTAAKTIATTGGHGDPTNGLRSSLQPKATPEIGVIDGQEEARKAVRQRYKDGADLIKITATGGVLSLAKNGQNPQFTEAELKALVETANDYGFHVAAHAHGAEGMKRALRAGVTTIEHGTYMDDEVMRLMKKNNAYYVPTIIAGDFVAKKAKIDGYFPAIVRPKAAAIGPIIQNTFAKAFKSGVNIAFGTDCGVSPHGTNADEFILMVEAGMTPYQALYSATRTTAELLDLEDDLGSLEAGKIADIIAVKGNPLKDVATMKDVRFVMKEGKVYKQL